MADAADFATDLVAESLEHSIRAARVPVPVGEPGECEACFEDRPRLVGGLCGFCRDGRGPRGIAS